MAPTRTSNALCFLGVSAHLCVVDVCDRYVRQSVPRTQNAEQHSRQMQEEARAASEVYDLVAVVYYHSSLGAMRAIDGQPLSGSMQHQSSRPTHQHSQVGHYTAAVFRPGQSPHCMPHADADGLTSRKKRELEQERSGIW